MPNLKIRRFKPEDLKHLSRIEEASFKDPYPPSLLLTLSKLSPEFFLVAEFSGKPVGYVSAIGEGKGIAHLCSLAVHPNFRGRGIAKRLLLSLIEELKNRGFKNLHLEVRVGNKGAIALYRSVGFKPAGLAPSYYHDGEDAQIMVLKLPNAKSKS